MNYSLSSLWLRRKHYYGIRPHDKHCYFYTTRSFGKIEVEVEDKGYALGFSKCNLTDERLCAIWNRMVEFQPIWMNLQPSIAFLLCKVIESHELKQMESLKYIELTGELLTSDMKRHIEDVFHVKVVNQYGSVEVNSIAFECPCGHLHCLDENCYIEIVDGDGRKVEDGVEGEVYVSTLTNYAMPLLRYQLGDRGYLSTEICGCGETGKILYLSTGRCNDYAIDEHGDKVNAYIFARAVENTNCMIDHAILQFQIIQKCIKRFIIRLVVDEDIDKKEIEMVFKNNIGQETINNEYFEFLYSTELLPDDRTGKLRWFINEYEAR